MTRRTACILLLGMTMGGCEKRSGEATVLEKTYVPAEAASTEPGNERVAKDEQWWVKVEMRSNGRKVNVLVEADEWKKLNEGDRVHVRYSEGKYTGTIWYSELK